MREHDGEPVRGLPGSLPAGERVLWQGYPQWWSLARRAYRVQEVGWYFGGLAVAKAILDSLDGVPVAEAAGGVLWLLILGAAAMAILTGLAFLSARSALYTVTDKRVVFRFGPALPMAVNVPFAIVESAALRAHRDGTGDIPLTLAGQRASYVILWPHVRPWQYSRPQPMLRCIPDAQRVAGLVSEALVAAAAERGVESRGSLPTGTPVGAPAPTLRPAPVLARRKEEVPA